LNKIFMKSGWNVMVATGLGLALFQQTGFAEPTTELKDQKSKVSYAVGMNIGTSLKRSGFDVDVDIVAGAIKDALAGKTPLLPETEAREVMTAYQQEIRKKQEDERGVLAEKNRKAGAEFLAQNKTKAGVKTKAITLPDGTTSELQYKVISEGSGTIPGSNDTVTVNYKGTLIDGKEFDSSAKHGQAAKFQVNRVIRGWTEALQLMKTGSKFEVYIPAALAYGDRQSGPIIEPGSTLIFEVELVSVEAPAAPAPTQPLTSDIIRVPSAEELKKGAKIEVIKPEDAARMAAEEAAKQKKADQEKK
jgi:FKBP-type peptidyl-prolyl cis-trans isomerase FklB